MNTAIIEWLSICPKCEGHRIEVEGEKVSSQYVTDGSQAKCKGCGHIGYVEVYGPEECDVAWNEDVEGDADV
ncbi:hypothetical protein [Vibrio hepatarius]|uniref:hypothetical protein n=1 Tax=Vibrio hepatarius TaxID=171383 RepID=UPI00148C9C46|nr:hypothetical protein [Vibrio hepatarius]NOI14812.1 hypothetical protein [Vibrio hepatarius]